MGGGRRRWRKEKVRRQLEGAGRRTDAEKGLSGPSGLKGESSFRERASPWGEAAVCVEDKAGPEGRREEKGRREKGEGKPEVSVSVRAAQEAGAGVLEGTENALSPSERLLTFSWCRYLFIHLPFPELT